MKKFISLILAVLMVFALAACGNEAADPGTPAQNNDVADNAAAAQDSVKLYGTMPNVGAVSSIQMGNSIDALCAQSGDVMVYPATMAYTPDDILTWASNAIAAGAKGLVFVPSADSVLPSIVQMCEESEVYFAISMRTIKDQDIKDMVLNCEYFAGYCYENEEDNGYQIGRKCNELGYKKIAITSTQKGDMAGDPREAGLMRACDEFGIEIVAEVRGLTQASEGTTAAQSLLAAYPDLDCIVQVANSAAGALDAIITEIASQNTGCHYMSIDVPLDLKGAWDTGIVDATLIPAGKAGISFDYTLATAKVLNAANGHKILDAEGNVVPTTLQGYMITSAEEAEAYNEFVSNDKVTFIASEDLPNFLAETNAELTAEWLQAYVDAYDPLTNGDMGN